MIIRVLTQILRKFVNRSPSSRKLNSLSQPYGRLDYQDPDTIEGRKSSLTTGKRCELEFKRKNLAKGCSTLNVVVNNKVCSPLSFEAGEEDKYLLREREIFLQAVSRVSEFECKPFSRLLQIFVCFSYEQLLPFIKEFFIYLFFLTFFNGRETSDYTESLMRFNSLLRIGQIV